MAARVHGEAPRRARELFITIEIRLHRAWMRSAGLQIDRHAELLRARSQIGRVLLRVQELALLVPVIIAALEAELRHAALELSTAAGGSAVGSAASRPKRLDALSSSHAAGHWHRAPSESPTSAATPAVPRAEGEHLHIDGPCSSMCASRLRAEVHVLLDDVVAHLPAAAREVEVAVLVPR